MRTILHSDCNNFYASVECVFSPELRGKPIAVCGDPSERHGIVLAKSDAAKKCGIKTGEAVWTARQKCPELIVVPPCGEKYVRFSHMMRDIYAEYSDHVEPFGLDESWLDVTGRDGMEIACSLRRRALKELGITLSVGVSFNKVFAKLGSDMHKPDATAVITPRNYKQKVWPMPACSLLFIGRATMHRLYAYGLNTIGDIVRADPESLHTLFGKNGDTLYAYAAGKDDAPVMPISETDDIKSVGNSTTPAFDICDYSDAGRILYLLCDSVAERMRKKHFRCRTVTLWLRDTQLQSFTRQMKLERPTDLSADLSRAALALLRESWAADRPLRSLGVQGGDLMDIRNGAQLSILPDPLASRQAVLEKTADQLHARFGAEALYRGVLLRQDHRLLRAAPDSSLAAANMAAVSGRQS